MTDKRTRRRFDRRTRTLKKRTWKKRPFLTTDLGRKVGANYVPLLADYIAGKRAEQPPPPPRGLEHIITALGPDELALSALGPLMEAVDRGIDYNDPSARQKLCAAIGAALLTGRR
jgi:hypothetical protein